MSPFFSALMRPGMRLMAQLPLSAKMMSMALVMLVPVGVLLMSQALQWQADSEFVRSELEGVATVQPIIGVITALQVRRGLSLRVLSGESPAQPELTQATARLRSAVQGADAIMGQLRLFRLDDAWPPLRERLLALADGPQPTVRAQVAARHTELVDALQQLLDLVAERSRLLLDPELVPFTLMSISMERVVPWLDAMALTRGQGAALLVRGEAGKVERAEIRARLQAAAYELKGIQQKLEALVRSGTARPASWEEARQASEHFAALTDRLFDAEMLQGDAPQYFESGTHAIALALRFNDEALADLEALLTQREQAVNQRLLLTAAISALGIAVLVYLAVSFYSSFRGSMATLLGSLDALAAGRLSLCVPTQGRDELAQVGRSVEHMGQRLSSLVAEIRSSAVRVGQAGQQLAEEGAALSQRTETQATHLRGSIGTISQLSTSAAANAEAAVSLDALLGALAHRSADGSQAMQHTIESIAALQDSARRVAEINGVIDDIAFQTNLLALNASVEAARAGDSGKGFAVVAAEVRQLALRCAESAGEIRELIAGTSDQVGVCSQRAQQVDAALRALVGGVDQVSGRLQQISSASMEQSQGLDNIATSVSSLDDLTRQNAAAVERSSVASQSLVTQAQALRKSVAAIHLRQGSADEAQQMVEQALQRITQVGWEQACQEFNDPVGAFVDRDMYVFVIDRQARYLACSVRPAWVGCTVHEHSQSSTASVDHFMEQAWAAATRGTGWIEYEVYHIETGEPMGKSAYIARLDDEAFIGCGVYRQAGSPQEQPAAQAVAA